VQSRRLISCWCWFDLAVLPLTNAAVGTTARISGHMAAYGSLWQQLVAELMQSVSVCTIQLVVVFVYVTVAGTC
jgi:hypothetical protein